MNTRAGFVIQVIAGTDANGEPIPGYIRASGDDLPIFAIVRDAIEATVFDRFLAAHNFARKHCGDGRVLHYPSLAVAAMPREGAA